MLKLNKVLSLILLMFCIVLLTACDYSYYLYHNTDGNEVFLNKDVTSIELIKYENLIVQDDPLAKHELDLNKLETLESLDSDNFESFINELATIGGLSGKFEQVLKSPNGVGIRIIYDDGSFTLTTITVIDGRECIFLGEYNTDEKMVMNFGISWQEMIDDFKVLINEYFTTQIN